jgi:hypothetical protein
MKTERLLAPIVARCLFLGGVVLLAAVPIYVYLEPPWRPLLARLAAALVLGAGLLQLRRAVADRLAQAGRSALDEARHRRRPDPGLPHHFQDMVHDVRFALRSRRYFEEALWPRLEALARGPLPRPRPRLGRGPSLAGVREVIAALERQQ